VAASLRRAGRKVKARAYDAMIAATATANGLPLYTCNPNDYSGIDGMEVVPVPLPEVSTRDEAADVKSDDPDRA
jgi:predicted nucleic acid-binding protein